MLHQFKTADLAQRATSQRRLRSFNHPIDRRLPTSQSHLAYSVINKLDVLWHYVFEGCGKRMDQLTRVFFILSHQVERIGPYDDPWLQCYTNSCPYWRCHGGNWWCPGKRNEPLPHQTKVAWTILKMAKQCGVKSKSCNAWYVNQCNVKTQRPGDVLPWICIWMRVLTNETGSLRD